MKPNLDNWSIVVNGSWNARLFNPRWISEKLFGNPEQQVQVLVPLVPGFPQILTADGVGILPSDDSLVLRANSTEDSVVNAVETTAVRALSVLEHTPVRQIGVNFEFIEMFVPAKIDELFKFSDEPMLIDAGLVPVQRHVTRTFTMDRGVLNLIFVRSAEQLKIVLNYHLDLDYPAQMENARQAIEFIDGRMLEYKGKALHVLTHTYELSLDEQGAIA